MLDAAGTRGNLCRFSVLGQHLASHLRQVRRKGLVRFLLAGAD